MTHHPRNPYLTVDVIVEVDGGVVFIERANEPRGWALPGGFVDYGESPEHAARREVREETGLEVELTSLLGTYGDPGRDPRQHNVSIVYVGRAEGTPVGGDDAKAARVAPLTNPPVPLCFDHARIVADYGWFKKTGETPRPMLPADILRDAARDALEAAVLGRPPRPAEREGAPDLLASGAAFVTLRRKDGSLRGCIGELEARRPLIESVRANAIAAATRDPRFPPVTADEVADLCIAISVLTPPRQVADAHDVVVGRHGLLIRRGEQRGVLLPEVATDQGWDRETFLAATCRKAGLPTDAWRQPDTALMVFETIKL